MNDTPFHYDLIADIHGRIDKLEALLARLGYHHDGTGYVPPAGRRALFLGDLIDPKPGHGFPGGVRATLRAVKTMHDRGHALVLMGNHELNAVCYHTPGRTMEWLRHHGDKNRAMHQGTLDDFPDHVDPAGEWRTLWMPWFKRLPIFLDLGGLRAVHACWHPQHIALLAGRTLEDDDFLHAAADKATPEGEAIEAVLKGIEVPLPAGTRFADHTGTFRDNFRARWWEAPDGGTTAGIWSSRRMTKFPPYPPRPKPRRCSSPTLRTRRRSSSATTSSPPTPPFIPSGPMSPASTTARRRRGRWSLTAGMESRR